MLQSHVNWDSIIHTLKDHLDTEKLPSVNMLAQNRPWESLVSTLISLRTRDSVTTSASKRLLEQYPSVNDLAAAECDSIAELIYPAGFYRVKAECLKKIALIIMKQFAGTVPDRREALLSLPGVGPKTANLVLSVGFGIPAICVDIHVHRISNRTGWVQTDTPEQTESALAAILPRKYWIDINMLLVNFGQKICTPASPWCSRCAFNPVCPKNGIRRSR
ncbi:MAG: endonuclease III [Spirochaetales bacterium]|nr:endonuclease III [Spirochaetales bacterium]